jgi:hypothetical protein
MKPVPAMAARSTASHRAKGSQPGPRPVRDHRRMLFPVATLAAIRDGSVDLAFRRWERARVRPGSRLRTRVGVLEIARVDPVERSAVGEDDARRSGAASREDLLAWLDKRGSGDIYRIELRYAGADPRVELRSRADLSEAELAEVTSRLERLDGASHHGPWTRKVLELIAAQPEVRAVELAAELGQEKLPFKRDVRKLKELGLTESLNPGYRLSPRGEAVVRALRE